MTHYREIADAMHQDQLDAIEALRQEHGPCGAAVQADQWDEALRGKKMSDAVGRVIFKYQMPVLERFTMRLPRGAEIVRVADQGGMFWLWAVVDTSLPDEDRKFVAVKCGANVPEGNLGYIGFCAIFVQQELGLYIFEDHGNAED